MALGSPGVQVTVIDESFYTPSAPGTTPIIFVATAQNKKNASGTGTAQGTLAANAGKVYVITSQRDLVDTFGTPVFYTDSNSNPIHGGELNEYGLQAAYSVLGASSRAYIARADVNLAELIANTTTPVGSPVGGTYWVDTASSLFGISEWNNTTQTFTDKKPLIIDNTNRATAAPSGIPLTSFGSKGDYAVVVTSENGGAYPNAIYYKKADNQWGLVTTSFDGSKQVAVGPHTSYPTFTQNGSVWIKTTTPSNGANWAVKYYNASTQAWSLVKAPIYNSIHQATQSTDLTGGGSKIPVGSLFIETDTTTPSAKFKLWRRSSTGSTNISVATTYTNPYGGGAFEIRESLANSTGWSASAVVTIAVNASTIVGSVVPAAISAAGFTNIVASWDAATNMLTISHKLGGNFEIKDTSGLMAAMGFTVGKNNLYASPDAAYGFGLATNWKPLVYEAKSTAPLTTPADGRLWYDGNLVADIMIHNGTKWVGYLTGKPGTNATGPQVNALAPTTQSNGDPLVDGDIWISTADMNRYGKDIYVWNGDTLKWVLQDVSDQTTPNGWVFADARWSGSGDDIDPDSIAKLLTYDYVDPDAPDPALYPKGIKLWNLRRSGFNIKKFVTGYIDANANNGINIRVTGDQLSGYYKNRWVTVSSNNEDGSGKFGTHAQRGYIVSKLKSMIDTNAAIRDTDTLVFNLIATPGYPEAIQNMIAFNTDRGQTAFVVGDTPFRLAPNATALNAWGMNTALATDNGDNGAVSYDEYMGMFYPSGYTTDNSGNNIVVPPSHMMLRTIINSDAKSYQWFAPAGTRRGGIDNATSVGYINSTGEFNTVALYEGLRNVLHDVKINPIATLPGVGIVNMGQYTRAKNASALDRINVVRLVAFLRRQLAILAKPYLFEPNDTQTRREIKAAAESLLLELVGQRALYDYVVVCDTTNNTPARIDRSELYMDIAIEPVKAVEFIYIPLRIKNTGAIKAGK